MSEIQKSPYRPAHYHPVEIVRDRDGYHVESKPGGLRPLPRESFAATPGRIAVWVSRR